MSNQLIPHKLLVEDPTYEVKILVEEKNRNAPSNLYIQGPFIMANEANKNKRIYPLDEVVNEVARYNTEMIDTNRALGELNHPSTPDINLERACHMVTELKQHGNIWLGKSKILSTPMGQITRNLIMDNVKIGVSTRSLGQLIPEGSFNRVSGLRLVATDIVADPSVPTAFVNGILESKQWILNEHGEFEIYYDKFEKSISSIPKSGRDQYLKGKIIEFINALKNS